MRKFFLLPLLILVAGCGMVPFRKLVVADMLELSKAPFYVVQEDAPAPEGVVGKSKKEHPQIASPAEEIEKALTAKLIKKGQEQKVISFKGKKKPENVISWMHGKDITEGVVLDVQTGNWGMEPHPRDSTRYVVWLNAKMELVNIEENAVLAEYTCYSDTSEIPLEKAPTKYQLLKDDGVLVKKMFVERARACTKEITERVLSNEQPAE